MFMAALALAACASSPPPGPMAPSGSVPGVMDPVRPPPRGPNALTSRPDCDKLVDHLDSVVAMTGHVSLFRAPNQDPGWHRSRVDECTISVDKYDRDCLFGSHDINTAQHCGSRFFADTMRAYRFQ